MRNIHPIAKFLLGAYFGSPSFAFTVAVILGAFHFKPILEDINWEGGNRKKFNQTSGT